MGIDALIMIIDRDGNLLFSHFLTYHILVQLLLDLRRSGEIFNFPLRFGLATAVDYLLRGGDASVADIGFGAGNHNPYLRSGPSAEGADLIGIHIYISSKVCPLFN
jgi:hypothetical protein